MPRTRLVAAFAFGLLVLWGCSQDPKENRTSEAKPAAEPRSIQVDLDKAVEIAIPKPEEALKPKGFQTPDGREGWAVQIPGNLPLATPAYADGLLFVGGGYGSYAFYAFDAQTGALVWQIQTGDDGPTAAVVEDGCVAFNTESCTVFVVEAKTGKILWQEWLGDPLMSQPAIWKGRLYIAFPAGQRGQKEGPQSSPAPAGSSHALLCADLRTGKHLWERPITADVISAPVIADGKAVFTCFDGTSFCIDATDGTVAWQKKNDGTSAPIVAGGRVIFTQKEVRAGKNMEGIAQADVSKGEKSGETVAAGEAKYLDKDAGGGVGLEKAYLKGLDSNVGFSTAPTAAGLPQANEHLGVQTVAGGWAYQGSRAAYSRGQVMNAQGRFLNCVAQGGQSAWRAEFSGKDVADGAQIFSPPSLGLENLYLCSAAGHLVSVSQKDGTAGFLYSTKVPMASQPALAGGNLYVGTADGRLVCLKAGADADGWTAWGGNAQHNKAD